VIARCAAGGGIGTDGVKFGAKTRVRLRPQEDQILVLDLACCADDVVNFPCEQNLNLLTGLAKRTAHVGLERRGCLEDELRRIESPGEPAPHGGVIRRRGSVMDDEHVQVAGVQCAARVGSECVDFPHMCRKNAGRDRFDHAHQLFGESFPIHGDNLRIS